MKILFLDTLYPPILEGLGFFTPPKKNELFKGLIDQLNQQRFASGSALAQQLSERGNVCHVVYVNARKSQEAWIHENGHKVSRVYYPWKNWQIVSMIPIFGQLIHNNSVLVRTVLEQVRSIKPDVVYCLNINFLNSMTISKLKAEGVIVVGQHASPLPQKTLYTSYDHIFSAHPGQVVQFQKAGVSSSYLPLAFDLEHEKRLSGSGWPERHRDVSFIGTFGRHQKNTAQLMKAISETEVKLDIFTLTKTSTLKKHGLFGSYRGKAWGEDMYKILSESKIVINRHGEIADGYSVNFRMFEATGMGAILVTESSKNIQDLFEPGTEVVTYDSPEDAALKIAKILRDFSRYEQIAIAGQKRTLKSHTFSNRAEKIEEKIRELNLETTSANSKTRETSSQ
jgi:spore maturation protein CgeB